MKARLPMEGPGKLYKHVKKFTKKKKVNATTEEKTKFQ